MRFYLDEDLSPIIAELARRRGLDATSALEAVHRGVNDEAQLRLATAEQRCLVTRNRNHFLRLTVWFFEKGWPHAGVLIVPSSVPSDRFADIAAALVAYDHTHPEGVHPYTIDYLKPAPRD